MVGVQRLALAAAWPVEVGASLVLLMMIKLVVFIAIVIMSTTGLRMLSM